MQLYRTYLDFVHAHRQNLSQCILRHNRAYDVSIYIYKLTTGVSFFILSEKTSKLFYSTSHDIRFNVIQWEFEVIRIPMLQTKETGSTRRIGSELYTFSRLAQNRLFSILLLYIYLYIYCILNTTARGPITFIEHPSIKTIKIILKK